MYKLDGVAVRGVATVVPVTRARTVDYDVLSTDERARFAKATGIHERRIVAGGQCASDLCAFAVQDLLDGTGWPRDSIGLAILITQTGDYPVPATSIVLQHRLGLSRRCICFDINLGCSAYPYGLAIAASMMRSLGIARALLMIGDVSSKVCSTEDKSAWPLFGDAGSATALELADDAASMYFHLMNDGSGKDAIIVPAGGLAARLPITAALLEPREIDSGIKRNAANLILRGADIFSFAIQQVPPSIQDALASAGCDVSEVDFFVLHQANRMINETIRTKLGVPREKFLYSLGEYGNTSSVSIPLTLSLHGASLGGSRRVVLSGFGVGLSWGSAVVTLPAGCHYSLSERADEYPA